MNHNEWFDKQADWAHRLLGEMIAVPSTRGGEAPVHALLAERLAPYAAACELLPVPEGLVDDPEYSLYDPGLNYAGKNNLRLVAGGKAGGKTVILNSHSDVVPPSGGQTAPYEAIREGDTIYGRGACDAKGQLAVIALVLKALAELGGPQDLRVITHIASEEESGGNGTLALVRAEREAADMAIVFEPTQSRVMTSVRGAVWFHAALSGTAGHVAVSSAQNSAIYRGMEYIRFMEDYHRQLKADSAGYGLFKDIPNAVPLTFGTFNAGTWASSVPDRATITGVMGLLPNTSAARVIEELGQRLAEEENAALRSHLQVDYPYRHDAVETDPEDPLVRLLLEACAQNGQSSAPCAMNASCDAVFYSKLLGLPTVVYGPGDIAQAHTRTEQIELPDILAAARTVYDFLCRL